MHTPTHTRARTHTHTHTHTHRRHPAELEHSQAAEWLHRCWFNQTVTGKIRAYTHTHTHTYSYQRTNQYVEDFHFVQLYMSMPRHLRGNYFTFYSTTLSGSVSYSLLFRLRHLGEPRISKCCDSDCVWFLPFKLRCHGFKKGDKPNEDKGTNRKT